ncbi:MAG: cohesin domain-containing protein [Euryarchaeota archaeon]|nr:cohesin domain-containing protein [Euryarchaeota archaeon]
MKKIENCGSKLLVALIAMVCILQVVAASAAGPFVSVDSRDASPGETFTINVTVDPNGNSVYGAQYCITFDPEVLQVVSQAKGDFLSHGGVKTLDVTNKFDNTVGELEYGAVRLATKTGVNNSGVLTRITFEAVSAGSTNLLLSNVILADPLAQAIDGVVLNNGTVNGTATPRVIVTIPDAVSMGAITVPITIEDVSNVGTCQLTLSYDPDVVIVSNVSSAHSDSDFDLLVANLENAVHGSVGVIAYQGSGPGLSGDVSVAYVTFMVLGPVGSSTPLDIEVTTLTDATPDCNRISHSTRNGSFAVLTNGDVNGDGEVDSADTIFLAQHLLGAAGFEMVAGIVADVNDNGVTEASDCMYLTKHLARISGFEVLK